jgi:peptidyl-prolyl cis-trans isomerase SurA
MNMKKGLISLLLIGAALPAPAQTDDPVVMTVNGKDIRRSEFVYSYSKNNTDESIEKKSLDEYVELFKNFKLWIAEGEAQQIDTTAAFRTEFSEYRSQLAAPYLKEPETDEALLRREYGYMQEMVEMSHILVIFPGFPDKRELLPADTLATLKKAQDILKRVQKKGADFAAIAREVSDDNNTKERGGYLGWFSGLKITFPLESASFNTPEGQCAIARSGFGYHIIKVNARKPHPGEFHAAHILVSVPRNADTVQIADAEKKIKEIYDKALAGEDFAELAKTNSDDKNTAGKGGDIGWFDPNTMVQEFRTAVENLKDNEISAPIRTAYGFHIVKFLGRRPNASYENTKEQIASTLSRYGYFIPVHQPGIDKLKKELRFTKNDNSYEKLTKTAITIFPFDSLYTETFKADNEALFSISGQAYKISDFIAWLNKNNRSPQTLSTEIIDDRIANFEYQSLYEYRDSHLEAENEEFRNLVQEYRDGIILFEVKNREIWDKASNDTLGLEQFFIANKQKYKWNQPRFKGYVVLTKDADTQKQMQKEIRKMKPEEAAAYLLNNYKVGEVSYVKIEKGLFAKGDNKYVDAKIFGQAAPDFPEGYNDYFLIGKKINNPESADDVRGQIITEYQDYLEQIWTERLNAKYPVSINQDALKGL